jgi:predicted alpha/beta hydrolase family esterase
VKSFKSIVLSVLVPIALAGCTVEEGTDSEAASESALGEITLIARGVDVGAEENTVPPIPIFGKRFSASASLYAADASKLPGGAYRGAVLLNPGAVVRSRDMATFAEGLAKLGYITYVANNAVGDVKADQGGPVTGPIPLLVGNLIPNLAQKLASDPKNVKNLPANIAAVHDAWNRARTPKIVAVGHSLGGAVLGSAASRTDNGLSRIVLIGTDELVDAGFPFGIEAPRPGATPVPIVFVRGEKDGLAEAAKTATLAQKYPNAKVLPAIAGVNHFCIIDGLPGDSSAAGSTAPGAPGKRAKDGTSTLPSVQACVNATLTAIKPYLD